MNNLLLGVLLVATLRSLCAAPSSSDRWSWGPYISTSNSRDSSLNWRPHTSIPNAFGTTRNLPLERKDVMSRKTPCSTELFRCHPDASGITSDALVQYHQSRINRVIANHNFNAEGNSGGRVILPLGLYSLLPRSRLFSSDKPPLHAKKLQADFLEPLSFSDVGSRPTVTAGHILSSFVKDQHSAPIGVSPVSSTSVYLQLSKLFEDLTSNEGSSPTRLPPSLQGQGLVSSFPQTTTSSEGQFVFHSEIRPQLSSLNPPLSFYQQQNLPINPSTQTESCACVHHSTCALQDVVVRNTLYHMRPFRSYTSSSVGCHTNYVCCRNPTRGTILIEGQRTCSQRNSRGLLGRIKLPDFNIGDSEFGEHPWQTALLKEDNGEGVFLCGGALVTDRHVLTAAHCISSEYSSSMLKVRLGEWDVSKETEFYDHVEFSLADVEIHPQYYAGNLQNDIAVVTLMGTVDFEQNPHVSPVCLPDPKQTFEGQRCHSTGWGKDAFGHNGRYQHVLKEVEVPIVSTTQCEYALRSTHLGGRFSLHQGMMCAGGEEDKDACSGDGGGPLVCEDHDGTTKLAGLVSWGIGCGQSGIPGVYVNIPYYMDWITATLQN